MPVSGASASASTGGPGWPEPQVSRKLIGMIDSRSAARGGDGSGEIPNTGSIGFHHNHIYNHFCLGLIDVLDQFLGKRDLICCTADEDGILRAVDE